jgi:hypothetical protein
MISDVVKEKAQERGIPIIYLDHKHVFPDEPALPKSYIEMVQRFEALAEVLGADVAAAVATDKEQFCDKAEEFKKVSFEASRRGVRALAGYLPFGPAAANGDVGGWLMSPDAGQTLMMLEELGMPILHVDALQNKYYEWNAQMSASNLMSTGERTGGRVKVPYPVDFFLHDPRGTLDFTSESFAEAWPHPAVKEKQYAYWPHASQVMRYSYRHATDTLRIVGEKLGVATKLNMMETECTDVNVLDSEHHRTTGLSAGQYACWNPVEYGWCTALFEHRKTRTAENAVEFKRLKAEKAKAAEECDATIEAVSQDCLPRSLILELMPLLQ